MHGITFSISFRISLLTARPHRSLRPQRICVVYVRTRPLNAIFSLGASAATVCAVGMARKLNDIRLLQTQNLLETTSDILQHLFTLCSGASLGALVTGQTLANGTSPETDTIESLANIDHDTHDLVVVVVFERFANGSELGVEPEVVNGDCALILEGIGPFAAVFVLLVFPFGADAFFEEVVVGFEAKFGGRSNVVLQITLLAMLHKSHVGKELT